jgi:hypothetical protein
LSEVLIQPVGNPLIFSVFLLASRAAVAADGSAFTHFDSFRLGETTLAGVQRELGQVEVVHTGEASETLYTICYRVGLDVVLFMSSVMGGPERSLGGIRIATGTDRIPCRDWPSSGPPPTPTIGGIRIGSTLHEARAVLGQPVEEEDGELRRTFETTRPMSAGELRNLPTDAPNQMPLIEMSPEVDVTVDVSVQSANGRVIGVEAWKSETF